MTQAQDFVKKIQFEGVNYSFAMPAAVDQRAVLFRLGKYGIEPLIRGLAQAELGGLASQTIAVQIVGAMMARIPEDDFNRICDTMLGKLYREGSSDRLTIDSFSGNFKVYFTLAVLAMGETFSDFTGVLTHFLKSTGSAGEPGASQENASTQPSTGTSGDPA
ncbi:phage tail assembly chaperone [Pseudomonas putida]|uniref:phage tail assembly chaperone n=1 Tax=Pseudomonas putida TaxID=303 RepID=UPI0038505008